MTGLKGRTSDLINRKLHIAGFQDFRVQDYNMTEGQGRGLESQKL
jgi:hypothetical protein